MKIPWMRGLVSQAPGSSTPPVRTSLPSFFSPFPRNTSTLVPPLPILGWHVWVEGKELPCETEVRATNRDGVVGQTDLLRRLSIDALPRTGHFNQQADGKITDDTVSCLKRSKRS